MEFLLLGMESVGKSSIVRQLEFINGSKKKVAVSSPPATSPTSGVEPTQITKKVTIREVGGAYSQLWTSYIINTGAIIFVIDSSNRAQFAASLMYFLTVMATPQLIHKPKALVLTKGDLPGSASPAEIVDVGLLEELRTESTFKMFQVSGATGTGADQLWQWINSCVKGWSV